MKLYKAFDGTLIDLDHVIAVHAPKTNYQFEPPHMFTVVCALGSSFTIAIDDEECLNATHAHLVNAWENRDTQ